MPTVLKLKTDSIIHKKLYTYRWDGFLAKIEEYENDILTNTTHIIRDGKLALQDRDGSNTVLREYTWGKSMGGGIGGLLNLHQQGSSYSYLYDGKGNVTGILDGSEAMVAAYSYNVFGKRMNISGSLVQPFQFSTKRYDPGIGLNYYGYRFYNPQVERWMNRDPLGEAGGINLYGFVKNDPVNWIDPWGLISACDIFITPLPLPPWTAPIGDILCPSETRDPTPVFCRLMFSNKQGGKKDCFYDCPASSIYGEWTIISVDKCDDCPKTIMLDNNKYGPPIYQK